MAAEKLLSGFRKLPDPKKLSQEDKYQIATKGALAWIRHNEDRDWDSLAERAAGLFMAGYSEADICKSLDITQDELATNVDVAKISGFLHSEVARKIYTSALEGDQKMLQFVAERKMGWHKVSNVNQNVAVSGEVSIRPVLNMQLLTAEEVKQLKSDRTQDEPIAQLPGGVAVYSAVEEGD